MARRREWQDFKISEVGGDATQDSVQLEGSGEPKGKTLVRMIIGLDVMPDGVVFGATNSMNVSMGIGMMSEEAIASLQFPDPNVAGDNPVTGWLWRWRGTVINGADATGSMRRIDVDLRSQRKLMYGRPILVIDYNLNGGIDFSVEVQGMLRCLYLLE